jgi:predicted Zn-dependent protease
MKNLAVIILLILLPLTVLSQKRKSGRKSGAPAKTKIVKAVETVGSEKEEFDKAVGTANAAERIAALQKFVENFPDSANKIQAQELIVSARAEIADEKLRLSETESGTELFKLAVKEAPTPVSDKLFSEVLLQFPTNIFWRGQQTAAIEIARMIEEKAEGNAKQLLGLATFYLGTENAAEAERLANKVIAVEPNLPAAYQTLGLAHRLNFQLEESANAYAKALELDGESVVSRRSLAEMKRASGKADEAAALYREILAKDPADAGAQTGLILSLFDAGKRAEAEAEMAKSLEANANNLPLLVGAAYWYAAHEDGAKAVELAEKAVAVEPRYTWAHIALARGLMQQKRPLDAERTLLAARRYGNFPTLDYEIASARMMAGFFREAADALKKNFVVKGDVIETRLGGRVGKEAKTFTDLLALERQASIFQTTAADDAKTSEKLKSLLVFSQKLDAQTGEEEIAAAADEFVGGEDKMRLHRQLFAANRLLQTNRSLPKALELAQTAVGKDAEALNVPNASAAILADELYETRTLANSRNEFLFVPEIPRQTLSAILRGRIEEIAGWTLYNQQKPAEASVRLKRAVSVLPENSAWWRSSLWRLGAALQADGKDQEALDAYIKSYPKDTYESGKYLIIESLYQKINGSTEGLDVRLGARSETAIATIGTKTSEKAVQTDAEPKTESSPAPPSGENNLAPQNAAVSAPPARIPREVPVKIENGQPKILTAAETAKPAETTAVETNDKKADEEAKTETEVKTEAEVKTEIKSGDEVKTEEAKPETEVKAEEAKTEAAAETEAAKAETEIKTDETKIEVEVKNNDETNTESDVKTDVEQKPEEATKTEIKTEEAKPDEIQTDESKTDEVKTDEISTNDLEEKNEIDVKNVPEEKLSETVEKPKTETSTEIPAAPEVKNEAAEEKEEAVKPDPSVEPPVKTEERSDSQTDKDEGEQPKPAAEENSQPANKATPENSAPVKTPEEERETLPTPEVKPEETPAEENADEVKRTEDTPAKEISENTTSNERKPAEKSVGGEANKPVPVYEVRTVSELENLPKIVPKPRAAKQKSTAETTGKKSNRSNQIFDSVVIDVPKNDPLTETAPGKNQRNANQPPAETEEESEPKNVLPARQEVKADDVAGATRPRVIVTENLPAPTAIEAPQTIAPCAIVVGQENISLINGGGSLGILVGYKNKGDLRQIRAASSSPSDVEVIFDPQIGEIAGRSFYVIKSVSSKKGVYQVLFEAPCGKKEVIVRVR